MADAEVADAQQGEKAGLSRVQRLRQKRKERKKANKKDATNLSSGDAVKKPKLQEGDTPSGVKIKSEPIAEAAKKLPAGVEIEYVAANPLDDLEKDDPAYQEFSEIFARFNAASEEQGDHDEDVVMADAEPEVKPEPTAAASALSSEESDDENASKADNKLSNRKKRQLRRLNVASLKQIVKRPDLVEIHDCSSPDPLFTLHLKSYRNSVPIPRHWAQRRKYLQGKRGIEKQPFELPHFIQATGIADIRAAVLEKEAQQKLKARQRERLQPKMGKLDIDYQVLYNAFFRYQTKPKMTYLGDLYYEGKEFEVKLKEKTPGALSAELKRALGMPEGAPPPWLMMQQRWGPPPAYPKLKIPGVNAPIPPNAQWGYHPGGWGRAPVDELGRPIWGWIEELPPNPDQLAIDKTFRWGLLPDAAEEEEEEEEEEELQAGGAAEEEEEEEQPQQGMSEAEISRGMESVPGIETPGEIELRKFRPQAPAQPQELYQVVQPQAAQIGNAVYGSEFTYAVPAAAAAAAKRAGSAAPAAGSAAVNIIKSQKTAAIDVALAPEDLELSEEELRKKYSNIIAQKEKEKQMVHRVQEAPPSKPTKDDKKNKKKEFKF